MTLLTGLAGATRHIGLGATVSTSFSEPYNVARMFASLDHISGGRAAVERRDLGQRLRRAQFRHATLPPHALRYERAGEFVDVVNQLWDTWDDDAFIHDRQSGLFFDPRSSTRSITTASSSRSTARSTSPARRRGHPVIIQAGASDTGLELAARTAEIVFASASNPQDAKRGYDELKGRMAKYGRDPDSLKILAGLPVVIGRSQQEAEDKQQALQEMIHPDVGRFRLGTDLEADLSDLPLDEPIPPERMPKSANLTQSILRRHHEDHPRREPDLAPAPTLRYRGAAARPTRARPSTSPT